jgi:tetratricopeptide (TPR) repeat protein
MIPAASDITNMTLPWLFQDIRTEKTTGTAIFTRDSEIKKVYFKDGDILFASSNLDEDKLGEFLLRKEKITKAQLDQALGVITKTGKKLGAVLFEAGLLTSHELVVLVKLQIKEIILKLFGWRDGHYQFDNGALDVTEIIPLHISTGDLIIEGVSNLDWKVVRKSLPPITTIIRPASDPSILFQNAHLEQSEREVFSIIDGTKSIQTLCGLSGIGDFNTLKAIYVLLALRMVEKGEIKAEVDKQFVSEVVREKRSAAEPKLAPAEMKKMLQSAYDSLNERNHYEKLNVARNASVQDIKRGYFQHAKLYHPDRHFDLEMSDMKEKLEILFSSIHDAYEILSEQSTRDQYDEFLANQEKRAAAATAAQEARPNAKKNAEVWFREAKKRYKAQDFWGAEEPSRWAVRLEPENAEYNFHLGLALSRIPRRGHEAEDFFIKATKLDSTNVEYLLELGNFYMKNGLKSKALAVYQKALKFDPLSDKIKSFIKNTSA